jgi:hypothetical protein
MDSQFELKIMSETDPGNNLPAQAHRIIFWLLCVINKPNLHDYYLCSLGAACLKHIHHFPLYYKTLALSFARIIGPWFREQT